jgi:nitroreductase
MNIIDTIINRTSCRTFNQEYLNPADKKNLENFIRNNMTGMENEIINLRFVEKKYEDKKMKLDYGVIKGHNTYLLGMTKSTQKSRVNYGYIMEKIVLKATEMNISTCWVGYFDRSYFNELSIENGFEIPGMIVIGYSGDKQTFLDKFVRLSVKASKRLNWDKLFFNYNMNTPITPDVIKKYADSFEMVRLSPSSGNTQPWRIFVDKTTKKFHFFKKPINKMYEARGLHDIDMGIALSHFELTSLNNGLSGIWINHTNEKFNTIHNLQYIRTWKYE